MTEEDKPSLMDVLNAIDSLAILVTANESRFAHGLPATAEMPEAGPHPIDAPHPLEMEGLSQIEADVRAKIADRLRGAPTTHLHLTDDESD